MQTMLNFLQNKYTSLIAVAIVAVLSQPLSASTLKSCDYRVFNIKTTEKVSGLELLTQIADTCDFSLIIKDKFASTTLNKDLHGINIKDLSLDDVFDAIISDNDLYYDYSKNFLRVSGLKTKTFQVDYITSVRTGTAVLDASFAGASADTADSESTTTSTNTVTSNDTFDFWTTMTTEVTAMLNTGSEEYVAQAPIINQNAGLVTVTGTKKQLDRIEEYLDVMKKRLHKQVLIDVSILSVDLESSKKTGIDWSEFSLTLDHETTFGNTVTNNTPEYAKKAIVDSSLSVINDAVFTMSGLIDFLNTNGDTKVVSNPKVLTLNNQQALITIGDTYNYKLLSTSTTTGSDNTSQDEEVRSIFVGVLLNITPEITEKGEIILRINPSVSSLANPDDATTTSVREIAPDTSEKRLSTVVKVHNGNTIILGGLITTREGKDSSKVPVLGDLPLLGEAFQHTADTKSTQELIFVITPRVIGAKDNTRATLKDLGFSKRVYEQ